MALTGVMNIVGGMPVDRRAAAGRGGNFREVLDRVASTTFYDPIFQRLGATYGISSALLKAVASVESGFNPRAVSPSGAIGLMQFMPGTAASLGIDPWNPVESIDGAARYLRQLIDRFGGRVELGIAAYNAGPGAVQRYGGIPPYRETQNYVQRVLELAKEYGGEVNTTPTPVQNPVSADRPTRPSGEERGGLYLLLSQMIMLDTVSKLDLP